MAGTARPIRFKKAVVPMLNDIFMHLLRNSMDHGIELPETRISLGKPAAGTIYLETTLDSSNVLFRLWDDGGGLPMADLRQKALDQNITVATPPFAETDNNS